MMVMPCKRRDVSSYLDSCIFRIDNKPIERFNTFYHLGHLITSSLYDDEDIVRRRGDFIGQVNNVICYFRKLNSFVRNNLFRSYCTSFYGCELWSLDNHCIDDLSIAWRKGLRKIWNIPPQTHRDLIPLLNGCLPLLDEICQRFIRFCTHICLFHESNLIRFVASHGILHSR